MMQAADTAVRTSVTVEAPLERAFAVFTDEMASWWPPDHHLIQDVAEMVVEPRTGGRIYDRAADGSECAWARVLAYEPPHRLVFSWDISTAWKIETDLARTSEVEVRFEPEGEGRTRVELEHRHLDRHGPGWEAVADAIDGPEGWPLYLDRYAALLKEAR